MDQFTRGVLAYLVLTLSFCAFTYEMKRNGHNHPNNPAWHLVHGLRNCFLILGGGTVVLVCAGVGVGLLITVATERRVKLKAEREAALQRVEWERRRAQYEIAERQKERGRLEAARVAKETAVAERELRITEERRRKELRTTDEAVKEAIEDFV